MSRRLRVLVSSAGRRVQLLAAFRDALARAHVTGEVVTADTGSTAPATYLADGHFAVPPVNHPEYPDFLLELCAIENIDLLIPTIDPELPVLARLAPQLLEAGTEPIVSGPATIELAAHKRLSHQWMLQHGFPRPTQWLPEDVQDLSDIQLPVIVKPAQGSSSAGIVRVEDALSLSSVVEAVRGDDFVIETVASGREFTVSAFVGASGKCLAAVPRERLEVRAGEVSKARTTRQPAVEQVAGRLVEALPDAHGPLNCQVMFDDSTGEINVIEINARFGGGDPLAWKAGADAPFWIVQQHLGRPLPETSHWISDLFMFRYDEAVYIPEGDLHETR